MRLWIKSTGRHKKHVNTYMAKEEPPHHMRMNWGYNQIAQYRQGNFVLTVSDMPRSNPRCYALKLHHDSGISILDSFYAFIQAESIIPFLVRFNWKMTWNQIRYSFDICIPERYEPDIAVTYPIWFTPVTVGYQTIWYTTQEANEVYKETLLWKEDGTPLVDDYKFYDHIGREVREIVE